jgi:hypothetical protein
MLSRYTWDTVRDTLQHYRRRSSEAFLLYQRVYHSQDDLQCRRDSRFQHQYGCLRNEVLKTFDEYLNCGIFAQGAARGCCDSCKHLLLIVFSCQRRGVCPSCGIKRAINFAEPIHGEVIEDIPYRHTDFTISKRLRAFFRYDHKLHTILFRAAWAALSALLDTGDCKLAANFTVKTLEKR